MTSTSTKGPHRQTPIAQQRNQQHEHWKDSLRQACFDRARKNRKDLIWKKRHLPAEDVTNSGFASPKRGHDDARSLVEQELRQQRVAVVNPAASHHDYYLEASGAPHSPPHHHQHNGQSPDSPFHQSWLAGEDSHVLSEEELYELLQEVEAELRRSEEELVEEILEEERWHIEDVDQQVARYEEWEDSLAMSDDEITVICPICCEAILRQQSPTQIACSNDACHFHISGQILSLPDLKERLRSAFDEHSSVGCSCNLTIGILHNNDYTEDPMEGCGRLFGSCQECDTLISIA